MEAEIRQLRVEGQAIEDNCDRVIEENLEQFDRYQAIVHANNVNTDKMIEDLRNVQKQHFEMENINESLEQRIDQLKGQRDLSVLLIAQGQENELQSQKIEAENQKFKLSSKLTNTQLAWEDNLKEKVKELEDAMKQASDHSINEQVQANMVQIREKNKKIVALTQKKEEINSKIQQNVSEEELLALQKLHSELIQDYEEIIKQKIDIFDDIIANLKVINTGNNDQIDREMLHGEKKL